MTAFDDDAVAASVGDDVSGERFGASAMSVQAAVQSRYSSRLKRGANSRLKMNQK